MGTFLFDDIIFGPVQSRRLGVSLGINLLPIDSKLCTFDCIYCECGWNPEKLAGAGHLPTAEKVKAQLELKLQNMAEEGVLPDVITFAGNGEPTLHPEFEQVIDDTISLRNQYAPKARIAVLSNSTMVHKEKVVRALKKVDDNILKLDSGFEETIRIMNCPQSNFSLKKLIHNLKKFEGKLIIQTMFLIGDFKGHHIDNTTPEEVDAWLSLIKEISPSQVMVYSIDRDTPASGLIKVENDVLEAIAEKVTALGIQTSVA
ncbi:MAG: radical SAM protein [Bacteroidota bacterium]|nr:radical SAM protein [Bacteroidota bacterium]MDP4204580.1 radical SAM protein [Bacteroidota bacterium]